ncbi:MAG: sulfate adenylyltransferase subunit CysN [Verrucomicrobiota bacterium]|nr:sulfate adenylyltransferase subunit CysN [Verrucomicrobiota bacterium]
MSESSYKIKEESLIRDDITSYLARHESKDLLRFLTCGSVDDGKSTLIGRLLYDSHMIYEDQLEKITKDSKIYGTTGDDFDPALLTDGLKAEREQGITIDVAYRYFSTDKRKFIIADCPGHEQYTRNMATGASTCNLAVILIDARHGVITQTRRHSFICSLLGIKHVIVAINKMDLVDWSENKFDEIKNDFNNTVARLNFSDIHFIPLSALKGDNVVNRSKSMNWYNGPTFLSHLENVNISADRNLIDMRFPVQHVLRPDLNFRGFSGTVASGVIRKGDKVACLPSGQHSEVKEIYGVDGVQEEAFSQQSITLTLHDEIDVSRGNILVPINNIPKIGNEFEAMIVWMHEEFAEAGKNYVFKHTTNIVPGSISNIRYKVDVNSMKRDKNKSDINLKINLNEIARCHITLHRSIAFDSYTRNRSTGAFIIIDRLTNITVGAGMIVDRAVSKSLKNNEKNIKKEKGLVSLEKRSELFNQKPVTIWLTGLSGSGKTTIAMLLEKKLMDIGNRSYVLDGDNLRFGINKDLGFSSADRKENIRRVSEISSLMNQAGLIVITSFISPYKKDREVAKNVIGDNNFFEVYIDTPISECEKRDPKGLYKKVRSGELKNFTGIDDLYEEPENPAIVIPTLDYQPEEATDLIINYLKKNKII